MLRVASEVVASVPRKYNVTRILRYLVTMKNPDDTFKHVHWIYGDSGYGKQFAPFGAFDSGKCTATNCMDKYEEYGYAVGCQAVETEEYNYKRQAPATNCVPDDSPECVSGTWYSLPGACPHKTLYHKTDECEEQYPSAKCDQPDGSLTCTYNVRYAGQVELDELEGIPDYEKWWVDEDGPTGNIEYEKITDDGNGTAWWNERRNEERCNSRMAQVIALFGKRYPDLPDNLSNLATYFARPTKTTYRSSAAWALRQMDDRFSILRPDTVVLDLGCFPGGWSEVAVERAQASCSSSRVIGVDSTYMDPLEYHTFIQGDVAKQAKRP
ncbi:Ribosomal RNA large subunit methyltransferase E [Symbiodinium microadriaticum]|uniref:rRNA methyltransferase 2, mitochondrial n=1 Tax=Symbiodinium microadriaticum TaxID=2951 RepID=A0A1Q9DA92_SYMMI|nr:Ribosomal RNA large subunit methyltransferase E [Symbiodinium microadriaticum]